MSATDRQPEVTIRVATEHDLVRIVELFEHGALFSGKEDPADMAPYRAALAEIEQGSGDVFVAENGDVVVGVCQLIVFRHLQAKGRLCAEIESVHVHPDWRRRGVGRVLMSAAVARARALGCFRVQLTSNRARPDAHRFYAALGFEASHLGFKLMLD
jgi:GNAT superfamily N-acetyltransferase